MTGFDIVTGGSGFIGKHLVEALLKRGKRVIVLDKVPYVEKISGLPGKLIYQQCDVTNYADVERGLFSGPNDNIYHLAALADIVPSIENPRDYYETNVTGTFNVLEAARKFGCKKFIYAASASCYGLNVQMLPASLGRIERSPTAESCPCSPQYPYALTKYLGEQLVMHWAKVYGVPAISLRIFNAYGEGQRTTNSYGAMFKVFLSQLVNGCPLTIVGDGTQQRDFIYVDDVVDAFIAAAESDKTGGVYNLGSGVPTSVNTIADMLGTEGRIYIPKRPGEPDITHADITKIKNNFDWKPKVDIRNGVARLLKHLDDYRGAPLWDKDSIATATKTWFERLSA